MEVMTVSQLNGYTSALLKSDCVLSSLFVRGEITDFKNHYASGHLYFSLRDDNSVVSAVIFRSSASRLSFAPENGMTVIACGHAELYPASGRFQLIIETLMPEGDGALRLAKEALKRRLEAEGLFEPSRRRSVPSFPRRVAAVTSKTGAVIQDIRNVMSRRYPLAELLVYPVAVQGEAARREIVSAIKRVSADGLADVVIVGRGGGSSDDLSAFDDEAVVRAVAGCAVPVISAVGHETDFTLTDLAADLRAPTPSAAAELAVPDASELISRINSYKLRLAVSLKACASGRLERVKGLGSRLEKAFGSFASERGVTVDRLYDRLNTAARNITSVQRERLLPLCAGLSALDPSAVLKRGYAVVRKSGKAVLSSGSIEKGDSVSLLFAEGGASAVIEEVKK